MSRKKVTIAGAGNVGATIAQRIVDRELANVVLVDVVEGMPQGKALDLLQSGPVEGYDCQIIGANDYRPTAGSDIAVITAGLARKPGMSRDDLLMKNYEIVKGVTEQVIQYSPQCILVVVSNPLDAMVQTAYRVSGFPKERVVGMAGILDTARLRCFLAMELGCSVKDVQAFVLGGHGDEMVPVVRYASMGGIPVEKLVPKERLDAIVKRTRGAGGEIVKLLGFSAYYSPAAAAVEMVQSVLKDEKRIVPCSAYLEGEYGAKDIYLGVPVMLGKNGMEKIFEIDLTDEEKGMLANSVKLCSESIDEARKLL